QQPPHRNNRRTATTAAPQLTPHRNNRRTVTTFGASPRLLAVLSTSQETSRNQPQKILDLLYSPRAVRTQRLKTGFLRGLRLNYWQGNSTLAPPLDPPTAPPAISIRMNACSVNSFLG
ncbi:MAG: hypothetical protein P1U77_28365, partial [Rubripirellula sp.]|nr:hypothetical protein [Rubripirellula sp.]